MSSESTFKFAARVQKVIPSFHSREAFFEWVWGEFLNQGLVGIYEGTLLSEQAAEQGFETDSWTLDSAEAPRDRDWVGNQKELSVQFYFQSEQEAHQAAQVLRQFQELSVGQVEEEKPQDWDAAWKASFLESEGGIAVPPFWRISPPWQKERGLVQGEVLIQINPGAGFGTGTHETTQLCLQALGELYLSKKDQFETALDFGSGSGILSIALASLGCQVDGVEIDPLAVDNAKDNAELNGKTIEFHLAQPEKSYRIVVANILKPVLLAFADSLVNQRLKPGGSLILSGLIEKDVAPVLAEYERLLGRPADQVLRKGDWRALVWR